MVGMLAARNNLELSLCRLRSLPYKAYNRSDSERFMTEQKDLGNTSTLYDVFISHASDDRDFTRRLADKLMQRGLKVWLNETNLKASENWSTQIRDALEKSRTCIVVLSRTSKESKPGISHEWASIQECSWRRPEMPICSLRVEDVDTPPFLRA